MSINISKSPCMDCERKHKGCHSQCKEGQEYTDSLKFRNNEIKLERKMASHSLGMERCQ